MQLSPDRVALGAFGFVFVAALGALSVERVTSAHPSDPGHELIAHAEASVAAARRDAELATELLAASVRGDALPSVDGHPRLRGVRLVDQRGSVLAEQTRPPSAQRCPPRVIERPTGREARVIATWNDPCEALAALDAIRASQERGSQRPLGWGVAAGALLAALAGLLVRRIGATSRRRLLALKTAVERVGEGDLAVRVRRRDEDALGELTGAFNQMVEALGLSRERLEYLQRLAGWQDIARRLAHEIENPLTPIQLAVQEIARRYDGDDARFRRSLDTAREVVEEEVATLRRLVTAFSEFARLPEVKTAPADLGEFVRDMETTQHFLAEAAGDAAKKVTAEFSVVGGEIPVMIDRIMLRRAFENLVRNAAQAIGDRGGHIWVCAERRRVTLQQQGEAPEEVEQAWLVIEDDGPGVPAGHLAKIFDPYFTTKSEGTGLGLAIVRKIAIDHAGDVGIEARPEGGARFVIALPLRDPARKQRLSFVTFTRNS